MKTVAKNAQIGHRGQKLFLVPAALLVSLLSFVAGTKYESQIKDILKTQPVIQNQTITTLPKEAVVERIVDGDTVVLADGTILRYVGVTAPETSEPFEEEATEANQKLVQGKQIKIEYDSYTSDRYNRILAYAIVDGKNVSIELAKKGLAKVVIYQKRKPFIYQDQLIKAQDQAKRKKLGIWGVSTSP